MKKDVTIVEGISVSNIVVSKRLRSNNTSGHTGVEFDKRMGQWCAYINFRKKYYNLGLHRDLHATVRARNTAEARLHDSVIMQYWDSLTDARKAEFIEYLHANNDTQAIEKLNLSEK